MRGKRFMSTKSILAVLVASIPCFLPAIAIAGGNSTPDSLPELPSITDNFLNAPKLQPKVEDAHGEGDYLGKRWIPLTGFANHVFPGAIISMPKSRSPFHYMAIRLFNVKSGTSYSAQVDCPALCATSTTEVTFDHDAAVEDMAVRIRWNYDALAHIRQQIPASFSYHVKINGEDTGEKTASALIHSVNDCVFGLRGGPAHEWLPLFPLFAGYVNENSPKLDQLLKDALATGIVNHFDGYQSRDPMQVGLEVFAIWRTLQLRGIKYSDVTTIATPCPDIAAQHVRFPSESIEAGQANCVDGSVAIASVLQKIGIDTALVATQKHMFLIFYTKPQRQGAVALETTILGQTDFPAFVQQSTEHVLTERWRKSPWAISFNAAVNIGTDVYRQMCDAIQKEKDNGLHRWVCDMDFIPDARKAGFLPIPEIGTSPTDAVVSKDLSQITDAWTAK